MGKRLPLIRIILDKGFPSRIFPLSCLSKTPPPTSLCRPLAPPMPRILPMPRMLLMPRMLRLRWNHNPSKRACARPNSARLFSRHSWPRPIIPAQWRCLCESKAACQPSRLQRFTTASKPSQTAASCAQSTTSANPPVSAPTFKSTHICSAPNVPRSPTFPSTPIRRRSKSGIYPPASRSPNKKSLSAAFAQNVHPRKARKKHVTLQKPLRPFSNPLPFTFLPLL